MIQVSDHIFESNTPAIITWKFYLAVSIGVAILGAYFNILGGYPLHIILFNICTLVLLFLGVIYIVVFFFRKSEEKDNFRLIFEDVNLRIIWKKKSVVYPYRELSYRTDPEIIDDEGEFTFLPVDSPDFLENCDQIEFLDPDENRILQCNLGHIELYETLIDRIHTYITPWKPKSLSQERIFQYRKIPFLGTILSIVLYILSLGLLLAWIEADYIILGSLTGALYFFILDSAIFSLLSFLCYTASTPGRLFPLICSKEGILFYGIPTVFPWTQLNIYYFGLQRPTLRIQTATFSLNFNPAWVKNYSEFVKTLKPHQKISSFRNNKKDDPDTPPKFRFAFKRALFSGVRTYRVFSTVSILLFSITFGLFVATPLIVSLQTAYSDEMIIQSPDNTIESFNLSTSIHRSYSWFFDFSLAGNLEAFEVELTYESEYSYFSNYTTGLISSHRILQLNQQTVFSESTNSGFFLSSNSLEYRRWKNNKRDLLVDWFQQGENTLNFTIELNSDFQPNQSEEGVLNWSISEVKVTFSALKTGDGIPEATKLFPGFNAYIAQVFTFLSLLPFAAVIDMRLRKIF